MTQAQYDHMIKQLSPRGSDASLNERILPRTSIGRTNFLYATTVQICSYAIAVDAIVVSEEILGLLAKGHRFTQLLDDSIHIWMSCDRKMENFPSPVIKHQKDIQRGKVERRDREEIDGP
jgi:hypothetical protein